MSPKLRGAIAATALLLATAASHAFMVEYNVWYQDDLYEAYDYGDISVGNGPAMTPPSWACGRRFFDPSWYNWKDHYMLSLASGDFYTDIDVWLPLGGSCPQNQIVVQRKNGGSIYNPASGTHVLGIHSHHGSYWIDADGSWPACNCALPNAYLTLATNDSVWGQIEVGFDNVLRQPAKAKRRVLDQASAALVALQHDLAKVVTERRRVSLGKLEATVRGLEDQAMASAAQAARQADQCGRLLDARAEDSAHRACSEAGSLVALAKAALAVVAHETKQAGRNPPLR